MKRWWVLALLWLGCPGELRFNGNDSGDGGTCVGSQCSPLEAGCWSDADCAPGASTCDVTTGACASH